MSRFNKSIIIPIVSFLYLVNNAIALRANAKMYLNASSR